MAQVMCGLYIFVSFFYSIVKDILITGYCSLGQSRTSLINDFKSNKDNVISMLHNTLSEFRNSGEFSAFF